MIEATSPDSETLYLTPKEVAGRWRIEEATLANQRHKGEGIPFTRIGGRVLYKMADVLEAEIDGGNGWRWSALDEALQGAGLDAGKREKVLDHLGRK